MPAGGMATTPVQVERSSRGPAALYPVHSMSYHTVFDVGQAGFQWWISFLIGIASGLAILVGWALKNQDETSDDPGLPVFRFFGFAGMLVALAVLAYMYVEYHSSVKALSTRDYTTAEGVVTEFVHNHHGKITTESFRVNGILFHCSNGFGSEAFTSDWNTGFIRNGVEARITYRRSDILRVEVK